MGCVHLVAARWLLAAGVIGAVGSAFGGERLGFDSDWRFLRGDPAGAERPDFGDGAWRRLDVPHDWSIEGAPDESAPSGAAGGYYPTGVGWYRKSFDAAESWRGRIVRIAFDGVYMNAEVWVNGVRIAFHPYGYTPFECDLTPHLRWGANNLLAVRVDNSRQPNCRWYSGSGIYRHVTLEVLDPVHAESGGVIVSTETADGEAAALRVEATVRNASGPVTSPPGPGCPDHPRT